MLGFALIQCYVSSQKQFLFNDLPPSLLPLHYTLALSLPYTLKGNALNILYTASYIKAMHYTLYTASYIKAVHYALYTAGR